MLQFTEVLSAFLVLNPCTRGSWFLIFQGCNNNQPLWSTVGVLLTPYALIFAVYPLWCFDHHFIQIHFQSIRTLYLYASLYSKWNFLSGLMVTKFSLNFQSLCVPCRAKQDVVCYYGNRGSPEPIHLKAGLFFFFFFKYGCCSNLSVHIFLSPQPLALHVTLTFLFWCAHRLSVYWSFEPEGHQRGLLVSFSIVVSRNLWLE